MRKTKLTRCIAAAAAVCMLAVLSSCAQGRPEMYTSDNLAGEVSQSGDELMFYYYRPGVAVGRHEKAVRSERCPFKNTGAYR